MENVKVNIGYLEKNMEYVEVSSRHLEVSFE